MLSTSLDRYPACSFPHGWQGLICRYADYLPVSDKTPIITLHEGNTPLIPAFSLSERLGRGIKVLVIMTGLTPQAALKIGG